MLLIQYIQKNLPLIPQFTDILSREIKSYFLDYKGIILSLLTIGAL